jgi:hypothetical protein
MPKCTPRGGEKQNEFVSRCIKQARDDGKEQEQAVGMCENIWREAKKSETRHVMFKSLANLANSIGNFLSKRLYP